jgi:hypothetical protein
MTDFIERFKRNGDYSLRGMRDVAFYLLPNSPSEQEELHKTLNRGRDVLEDEDLLNMYLYSFGKMHKFKLVKAFVSLFEQVDLNKEEIEIYDWGCGQGLATICFLDCLRYFEIWPSIKKIYLIDQSFSATNRASAIIKCINTKYHVQTIVKDFDNLSRKDFNASNVKKIHFFSNILDVESYELNRFVTLFNQVSAGENYIVCVGPCYNRERVNEFVSSIDPDKMYYDLDLERGEWLNDWSLSLRICLKIYPNIHSFKPILINRENFPMLEVSLSTLRERDAKGNPYVDSEGKPFCFYWITINGMICATDRKMTELLGNNANDESAFNVLAANENKFQIAQAIDENDEPIYVCEDPNRPLLKIVKVPCKYPSEKELPIIINHENFPMLEVSLSSLRNKDAKGNPYTDREGNPFCFYWMTINNMVCATGRKLTELLGKTANDETAIKVLKENEGKFQITLCKDERGEPIYVDEETKEKPLLKILQIKQSPIVMEWPETDDVLPF